MMIRIPVLRGLVALVLIGFFCEGAWAQRHLIAPAGDTMVTVSSPEGRATVTIRTVKLENGCANACPVSRAWTELGAKEASVVQKMDVSIDGKPVPVPLSVYADMFEPGVATLKFDKGYFVLRIDGADGGEAYFELIYFDARGIRQEKVYASEFPRQPTQITRFYHNEDHGE